MIPSDLRAMYRQGRLLPFVGAGASMALEWEVDSRKRRGLSWSQLVDEAIRLLDISPPSLLHARGNNLQILEYFKLVNHGPAKLSNWLYAEMRAPDKALQDSAIHRALAELKQCRVFYTTNYDDFIERAFRLHGREAPSCRHRGSHGTT
jgi:NAD-dependent SIR2 family protein deacetylase